MTSGLAARWGGADRVADLGGPVHWVDFGGSGDGPPIVLVHGLGGSHLDWALVGRPLGAAGRVVALDLAGFGLSPAAGRKVGVRANAALLHRFLREVVGEPAVLVGNSMGGMIALLLAARHPEAVHRVVCIDAAVPITTATRLDPLTALAFGALAVPKAGELALTRRQARTTARRLVRQTLALCCGDPRRVPPELVDALVVMREHRLREPGMEAAFVEAARSVLGLLAAPAPYRRRMAAVRPPVLMLHGTADRLVRVESARQAARRHPGWRLVLFPDVGHVPQMEVPGLVTGEILAWLGGAAGEDEPHSAGPAAGEDQPNGAEVQR